MKAFLKISAVIVGLGIIAILGYAFVQYAMPVLDARSKAELNKPTIETLTSERDSLLEVMDSLSMENVMLFQKVELQDKIISSQSNSRSLQQQIQSQLKSLEDKMNATSASQHDTNGK